MLSPFERSCLKWISQGKTLSEVSLLEGRSIAEIESCLKAAIVTLGANSIPDAIEKAKLVQDKSQGDKDGKSTKPPNAIDVDVGARVRLQRSLLGMSQGTLAKALGITFQQVQKYEKGMNRVGASRLQNIANVLRVPVSYFFEGNAGHSTETGPHLEPLDGWELSAFLATNEAKDLNLAFGKITSPAVRKRVVGLVKAVATSLPEVATEKE